jgi:hypothetical protein
MNRSFTTSPRVGACARDWVEVFDVVGWTAEKVLLSGVMRHVSLRLQLHPIASREKS